MLTIVTTFIFVQIYIIIYKNYVHYIQFLYKYTKCIHIYTIIQKCKKYPFILTIFLHYVILKP
jgi:hypothetical protein